MQVGSRIPRERQIMNECYGSPPEFSCGHMARREDPGGGDLQTAKRGNEDSMHVTNATPHMQAFNAPIWLALEDSGLENAREDEMKIFAFMRPHFFQKRSRDIRPAGSLYFLRSNAFIYHKTAKLLRRDTK